tara:strand:+ start:260 stop:871 length:612 start_codon:yes stop_codon:yes gene_type:complete
MKQKKPSILKMVQNFVKESAHFVKEGAPVCSKEEYEERMSICVSCEHYTEKSKCGICGCHMPLKAGWKTSECADNPKRWNKLHLSDKEQEVLKKGNDAAREAKLNELAKRVKDGERSLDTFEMHTAGMSEEEKREEAKRLIHEELDNKVPEENKYSKEFKEKLLKQEQDSLARIEKSKKERDYIQKQREKILKEKTDKNNDKK